MRDDASPGLKTLLAHRPWARRVARSLVDDAATAEDLLQDTWAKAIRHPPDTERDPRPWLRRVMRNLSRNRHRSEGRRARREREAYDRAYARTAACERAPDQILGEAEQHRRVVDAVMSLDEPFKTAVVLRFYEGLTPSQIAARLEIPAGTVSSRLHRAISLLRHNLDAQVGGDRRRWQAALLPLAWPAAPAAQAPAASMGLIAMTLANYKLALACGLLLLLIGGGIFLTLDSNASSRIDSTEPVIEVGDAEPRLVGATLDGARPEGADAPGADDAPRADGVDAGASALPPIVESFSVRGLVVDPSGTPLEGAEVFALPRASDGTDAFYLTRPRFGRVQTDEKGRFSLKGGPMRGPRLVAWYEGFLPAAIDSPEMLGADDVRIVLGPPRTLRVMVRDEDGVWPEDARVSIGTFHDQVHDRTADPRLQSFYAPYRTEDPAGRRTPIEVALGTLAPVEAELAAPWGYVASPRRVVVAPDQDEVSFLLTKSARLRVAVVPEDGTPEFTEKARFEAYIFVHGSERVLWSQSHPKPEFDFHRELSVGRYRLEFRSEGRVSETREVEVRTEGEELSLRIAMRPVPPLARRADVRIRTTPGAEVPTATKKRATEQGGPNGIRWIVLARTPGDPRWREVQSRAMPGDEISVTDWFGKLIEEDRGLAGGEYDFLVAEGGTGRVGLTTGVRIFNDQDNTIDVRLEPGCFVRLSDVLDPDVPRASIRIRAPGAGVLPPYEFTRGGQAVWQWEGAMKQLTRVPLLDTLFGPFPAKQVQLEVTPGSGR